MAGRQVLIDYGLTPNAELLKYTEKCPHFQRADKCPFFHSVQKFKAQDTHAPFGQLSFAEFSKVAANKEEAQRIFREMDLNADQAISLQEYILYTMKKR